MRTLRWLALLLPAMAVAQPAPRPDPVPQAEAAPDAERPPAKPLPASSRRLIPPKAPAPSGRLIPPIAPQDAGGTEERAAPSSSSPSDIPAPPKAAPSPQPVAELPRDSAFELSACHLALRLLGTRYSVEEPVLGPLPGCGIAQPVRVTEVLQGIGLEGGALMRCSTARALALWMREQVVPAAARLPGAPRPVSITPGSTYDCRMRVGDSVGETLSEHASGSAIDIAALAFDDGSRLEIGSAVSNDLPAAFLRTVQAAACLHFATVLGPGSDAAHGGHLHLDVKQRKGGYRICE